MSHFELEDLKIGGNNSHKALHVCMCQTGVYDIDVLVIRPDLGKISAKTQNFQLFKTKLVLESSISRSSGRKLIVEADLINRKPYEKADIQLSLLS